MSSPKVFNLSEFAKSNIDTKLKFFFKFLLKELNVKSLKDFENGLFEVIDEDFLIGALEFYIAEQKVTAKITANNFLTSISKFFAMLSNDYTLTNPIFKDLHQNTSFREKAKTIIAPLSEPAKTEIASESAYNNLSEKITEYCNAIDENLNGTLEQLQTALLAREAATERHVGNYTDLASYVATKITLLFGFKNNVTANLLLNDIDLQDKTLRRDKYFFAIDAELEKLLQALLKCRAFVLQALKIESPYLLVSITGGRIFNNRGSVDNAKLFKAIRDNSEHFTAPTFYYNRRILEMIREGKDLCTISEITGVGEESCIALQKMYNESADVGTTIFEMQQKIGSFSFDNIEAVNVVRQNGGMLCPNCSRQVSASEADWVLLLKDDGVRYLVCSHCKGGR